MSSIDHVKVQDEMAKKLLKENPPHVISQFILTHHSLARDLDKLSTMRHNAVIDNRPTGEIDNYILRVMKEITTGFRKAFGYSLLGEVTSVPIENSIVRLENDSQTG